MTTKINPNAIDLAAGFEVGSQQPLDSRQYLTKQQMREIDENIQPSKYFAICVDDGNFYTYSSTNEVDLETGKFRLVSGDSTKLQYSVMPEITEDNKNDVIQYIGESNETYNKGSWYGATETTFYRFLDNTNHVSVYSKTLNILPSTILYDENGDVSSITVTSYSLEAFTIYASDGNSYIYQNGSGDISRFVWTELKDSDLTNAIQSLNFSDGKVWKGTQAEYDALPEAIKDNDSIFFYILDGEVSTGIINDDVVSTDTTFSSTKQMATFVTPETTALTNYYKKSDTMSKSEIMQVASKNLECEIVEVLPSSDISTSTIYLIKNGEHYDQYMYINSAWAMIGSTTIDLSDYATKEELDEKQDLLEYDTEPTSGSEKMVKSGGIYNAVNNRLKVVYTMPADATTAGTNTVLYTGATGTYVQGGIYLWNTTTTAWDLISTADVDLDDYLTSWVGTEAQWQALTAEQQAKYKIVNKIDDIGIGNLVVVDAVTNGDMNPVTSNAVFSGIKSGVKDFFRGQNYSGQTNCNNWVIPGMYNAGPTNTNTPESGGYGLIAVFGNNPDTASSNNQWIWQVFFGTGASTSMYFRKCINPNSLTPTLWTDWVAIV